MTQGEWKAIQRMVKGKDPMIIISKGDRIQLEYLPNDRQEAYGLTLPYGTTTLYQDSDLPYRTRLYLKDMYDTWFDWIQQIDK